MIKIFEISPGLLIYSIVTFSLLVVLLHKFAFAPLLKVQRDRQDEIHASIEQASVLRDEAREMLADYRARLANARSEAEQILEEARRAGDETKAEIITQARVESERTLQAAREQIEQDAREALLRIRQEVADLTLAATEKVTRKEMSGKEAMRLVQEAVADVEKNSTREVAQAPVGAGRRVVEGVTGASDAAQ